MDIDWLKSVIEDDDMGLLTVKPKDSAPTADEHLIAKFNEINEFITANGREPEADISNIPEFMLQKRLDSLRGNVEQCRALNAYDIHHLLPEANSDGVSEPDSDYETTETSTTIQTATKQKEINSIEDIFADDDLGLLDGGFAGSTQNDSTDIFNLKHVSKERAKATSISRRKKCKNFSKYEEQLKQVQQEISSGERKLLAFNDRGESLVAGFYYILGGVLLYLESIDITSPEKTINGKRFRKDGNTRCIFENGTESTMLYRSLAKALYVDGKKVTDTNSESHLFFAENLGGVSEEDTVTGYIYVLSSLSDEPEIKAINHLYKIGFAKDSIEKRIANAKNEPTYLMAPVKYVAGYQCLNNMSAKKLESLLHQFFGDACLDIEVADNQGKMCKPREWFIAPIAVIERVIELIEDESIVQYRYDAIRERIVER